MITAVTGHINVHETGALESCGHKCLTIETADGKLTAEQIAAYTDAHYADASFEHTVQTKMVYISNPTEIGTIYKKAELEAIYDVCKERGLYLFLDGARPVSYTHLKVYKKTVSIVNETPTAMYENLVGSRKGCLLYTSRCV